MNTDFITNPNNTARKAVVATGGGLTVASVIWIYTTFTSSSDFKEHLRQCEKAHDECVQKRSKIWQKVADNELAIERLRLQTPRMGELPQWTTTNQSVRVSE